MPVTTPARDFPPGFVARGLEGAGDRVTYVQTLRGIACIALVMFHVVGGPSGGLELPPDHFLRFTMDLMRDFRMPLFSFISGLVFWPVARSLGELGTKIGGKARRLLLPMVCVSSLYWILQVAAGIEAPEFWQIFLLPYLQFWFLPATFSIMTVFYLANYLGGNRSVPIAIVLGVAGGGTWVMISPWEPNLFAGYNAVSLVPFFMAGFLCANWPALHQALDRLATHRHLPMAAVLIGIALLAIEVTASAGALPSFGPERRALTIAAGMTGCLLLFVLRPNQRLLGVIGAYSYAIFLFHIFFTAAARMVALGLWPGVPDLPAMLFGLAAGIAGPMALAELILRSRPASLLLLGITPRPQVHVPRRTNMR